MLLDCALFQIGCLHHCGLKARCCLVYLHAATPSATVHRQLLWLVVNMWAQVRLMLTAPCRKTLVSVLCAAAFVGFPRAAGATLL
jgi:hypothetical protein